MAGVQQLPLQSAASNLISILWDSSRKHHSCNQAEISSILCTKTFQNTFSSWWRTVDGNKRWFTLFFLKIHMAGLLFPSYLFNGLTSNYFKEVTFIAATSSQFGWIPGFILVAGIDYRDRRFRILPLSPRQQICAPTCFVPILLLFLNIFLFNNNWFLHWYSNTEVWTEGQDTVLVISEMCDILKTK